MVLCALNTAGRTRLSENTAERTKHHMHVLHARDRWQLSAKRRTKTPLRAFESRFGEVECRLELWSEFLNECRILRNRRRIAPRSESSRQQGQQACERGQRKASPKRIAVNEVPPDQRAAQ